MATLHFKVRGAGDPGLAIAEIDARNAQNEKVTLDGRVIGDTPSNEVVVRRSALRPNVPNPFNPRTTVFFDLAQAGPVTVRVYSVSGRLVRTLVSGEMEAGQHQVIWDGIDDAGRSVASGTYHVQMVARDRTDSRSMVLLK
jgi:flagellar hook assembly protein FlgD